MHFEVAFLVVVGIDGQIETMIENNYPGYFRIRPRVNQFHIYCFPIMIGKVSQNQAKPLNRAGTFANVKLSLSNQVKIYA